MGKLKSIGKRPDNSVSHWIRQIPMIYLSSPMWLLVLLYGSRPYTYLYLL